MPLFTKLPTRSLPGHPYTADCIKATSSKQIGPPQVTAHRSTGPKMSWGWIKIHSRASQATPLRTAYRLASILANPFPSERIRRASESVFAALTCCIPRVAGADKASSEVKGASYQQVMFAKYLANFPEALPGNWNLLGLFRDLGDRGRDLYLRQRQLDLRLLAEAGGEAQGCGAFGSDP